MLPAAVSLLPLFDITLSISPSSVCGPRRVGRVAIRFAQISVAYQFSVDFCRSC